MSTPVIASPWTPYGLGDDPFFQAPLAPAEDSTRPISLFVGRGHEMQLLGGQVVGSASSRAVVQGPAGVGKTSFVNRLKVALAEHGVLTHEQPVRVVPGMIPRQFCAEVLRVLLQIRATLNLPPAARGAGGRALARTAAELRGVSADDADAYWRRVGRIVEGEDTVAAGVTIGPIGGQHERTRIPAEVPDLSLIDDVARGIALLAGAGSRARRVLLHVNNLENLSRDHARAAAGLFQDVRDLFLAEHGHWLFVGAGDLEQTIFRSSPQLGGIVPFAITLGPLAPAEVAELLARRYEHLRRGVRFTPPVAPDVAAAIYRRYRGDLRNFLRLLSRAVQHHSASAPGRPMDADTLVSTMAPFYWPDLVRQVGATDAEYLATILGGQSFDAEFRVADVAARTGITQASASKLVQRLVVASVIEQTRTAGKSVFYRIRGGDVTVALSLGSERD